MKLKTKDVKIIDVKDFDKLVTDTYKRTYSFQQQDDCKDKGIVYFSVPAIDVYDYENDTVPEEVNHEDMGVSFKAWLERDPEQKLDTKDEWDKEHGLNLWWERNFYPHVSMIINDLYKKGLLDEGNYAIDIDWID